MGFSSTGGRTSDQRRGPRPSMLGLGALTFATPLALGALALLPVIWWLLRFNPPRPRAVRFPPFRLLLDLI